MNLEIWEVWDLKSPWFPKCLQGPDYEETSPDTFLYNLGYFVHGPTNSNFVDVLPILLGGPINGSFKMTKSSARHALAQHYILFASRQ